MDIGLKSFISEDQLEQSRRLRQEIWEKNRRPDQPLECPAESEEAYDPRTLYERLKEQKDKKQEEFEESRKLKHCIKVLDNDECEFLEQVDEQKERELKEKLAEEKLAIEEFKKRVSNLTEAEQTKKLTEFKKSFFSKQQTTTTNESSSVSSPNQLARTNTRRQAKLLQNVVKRKKSDDAGDEDEGANKRKKTDDDSSNSNKESNDKSNDGDKNDDNEDNDDKINLSNNLVQPIEPTPAFKVLGVLPGLASYASDSSDASDRDSDSDTQVNSAELDLFYVSSKTRELVGMKKTIKKYNK